MGEIKDRCDCGGVIYADSEHWKHPVCYQCYVSPKPKNMTGDPAFDYILKHVNFKDFEVDGATVIEKKIVGPQEPRTVIEVTLFNKNTNKQETKRFNYKKLLRLNK